MRGSVHIYDATQRQTSLNSVEGILSKTISFSELLTSFANFRFFGPLFCFSSIEGKIPRDPSENRIGQADTFRLRGAGQRVRQDADRPGGERIKAERTTPTLHTADGRAEGNDPQAGIMIPTLMARHRVKRPAINMEGGTKHSYGAARPAAV